MTSDGFSLKRCILDAIFSGMIALIIFGPIAGVILDGYSFNFDGQRLAWIVGTVMLGRFLLSAFSATAAGRRLQARFESDNAGVYVRPPAYKSRMRWIIPLIVTLAICFPFVATKYVLTVAILGLIYVLLGLGLNIVVGLAGLLDLGYVAFYAIGAYGLALGYQYLGLGFWSMLPLAALMAAGAGALLGFPVLRMHGDYLAIVTLGFGEIIRLVLNNWLTFTGGPNGAGKTTVFNCLTGFYRASGGNILFNARNKTTNVIQVLGQKLQPGDWLSPAQLGQRLFYKMFGGTHLVNRAGLARTFQNIRLFREMSVVENLLVAQHMRVNRNLLAGVLNTPAYRRAENEALDRAFYWLEVVDLVDCANRLAGEMSYGQQRRLEIARAMCTGPEMICLDEPAAGLNPVETHKLSEIIRFLRDHHDITVLLIEHDMGMVMGISDDIIVLDHGDVIARGKPAEIQHNEKVIAAYLGTDESEVNL